MLTRSPRGDVCGHVATLGMEVKSRGKGGENLLRQGLTTLQRRGLTTPQRRGLTPLQRRGQEVDDLVMCGQGEAAPAIGCSGWDGVVLQESP